jgi:hypothetical protein
MGKPTDRFTLVVSGTQDTAEGEEHSGTNINDNDALF